MKHLKITSAILSTVMCMSMFAAPVAVIADETAAPEQTQTTEESETEAPKATEKPATKQTEKPAPTKAEEQQPEATKKGTEASEKTKPAETEKQEPKETEDSEPKEIEKQEPKETEKEDPKEPENQESEEAPCDETDKELVPSETLPPQTASNTRKNGVVNSGACGDNLTWSLDDEGVLTVSGDGEMKSWTKPDYVPWNKEASNIKSVIFSGNISSIGNNAFRSCDYLTSIDLPNGLERIGASAFSDCTKLTSITIPNSVNSIGSYAFSGCTNLKNPTIPYGVTAIGTSTFVGCTSLTSVIIPNSVTSIGNCAFYGCTGLTSITIPNSVTSIGHDAFMCCTSLTSITIPNSVTSLGDDVFRDCTGLTNITIQDGITSIAYGLFGGCTGLTSITIPNSVTSIGLGAFGGCTGLTNITIPNSVTSIGGAAFDGCTGLTSITIPDGVTLIDYSVFNGCKSLTSITIPNSVTKIDEYAFKGCSSLTSITIPNSVTSIVHDAFNGCTGLTSITIPDGVTSINKNTFKNCTGLKSITIPKNVTYIGEDAFYGCSVLTNVYYGNSEDKWKTIRIGSNNEPLLNANIQYGAAYSITVNSGKSDLAKVAEGTTVEITANTAPAGKVFDKWIVVSGKVTFTSETKKTTTFTMPAENVEVTATYKDVEYSIKVNNGSATPETAIAETIITLTADAAPSGKVFDKWIVVTGTVVFANTLSSITTFTMPAENVEVTATYKDIEYTIKVNKGSATPATATAGTVINLTADAAPSGKTFDKWIVDSGTVSLSNVSSSTTTFTMPAENVEVTATYKDIEYTIKVNNGSADPVKAMAGSVVKLTADAAPSGKVFDKWIVDSGTVSLSNASSSTTTFTMPAGNVEVTATYKDVPAGSFVIKVNNGDGNTTSLISAPGLVVNVKANDAPAGTEFEKWEVVSGTVIFANASSAATIFVMPAENVEITARYKSSLSVKGKTATVKYSKVKKKNQTLAVSKVLTFVDKGQGQLTYAKVSGNSKILINKTTGAITVKKKLKKKTYTVKVKVQASGNESCNPSEWKTVTFKIKVK